LRWVKDLLRRKTDFSEKGLPLKGLTLSQNTYEILVDVFFIENTSVKPGKNL